jgi:hypothetical protein
LRGGCVERRATEMRGVALLSIPESRSVGTRTKKRRTTGLAMRTNPSVPEERSIEARV